MNILMSSQNTETLRSPHWLRKLPSKQKLLHAQSSWWPTMSQISIVWDLYLCLQIGIILLVSTCPNGKHLHAGRGLLHDSQSIFMIQLFACNTWDGTF